MHFPGIDLEPSPALPLCPWHLQGGMEAVRELKRRFPDCPAKVVAVTADAFEVTRDDCMAAGFDGEPLLATCLHCLRLPPLLVCVPAGHTWAHVCHVCAYTA